MTENTNYERIKKIIVALLAKAKATDSEDEAATFIAGAERLLEKHQLSHADLSDSDDVIIGHEGFDARDRWVPSWHKHIYCKLAQYYGCRTVTTSFARGGYKITAVGRESAAVTTDLMFGFIISECNRLGRELHRRGEAPNAANGARLVGNALVFRIQEMTPKVEEARTEVASKNALITRSGVDLLVEELFPDMGKARKSSIGSSTAARKAADSIGLNRQAGHAKTLQLK